MIDRYRKLFIFFWVLLALAWFHCGEARAQQKQPVSSVQPDCMIFFGLNVASAGAQAPTNAPGTSILIDNRQVGCYGWTVAYTSFGFSAISLAFQSAPDSSSGGSPGTWANFAGTLVACNTAAALGVNPNIAVTQAITCGIGYFPWLRMNLTSITGAGAVSGVLYGFKVNSAAKGSGGGGGSCPGGATPQVQYNNAGACAGTAGATATATQLRNANGTAGAPGMSFADGTTGFFRAFAFGMETRDSQLVFSASGVTTNVLHDNDSWRCGEGEGGQRGICEIFSYRNTNSARFWDLTDTFLNWGDPVGGGAGNRVGVGRFSSEGANAGAVHVAASDGGAHVNIEPKTLVKSFANAGVTGTTLNKLAKLTGAPSTVVIAGAGDTGGVLGIVSYGAGTTGSAKVTTVGIESCVFDGATTAGHYVTISGSVAGDCHDGGATYPTGTQVLGRVLSTNGGGGTYDMTLFGAELQSSAGGSQLHSITIAIDGGGSTISTGDSGVFPTVAFACTINRIDISADQSGSITIDVWKAAGAIPTSGNKISASAPLTLSSAQLAQNGSLTGWTTSVSSGDVFGFSVITATTVTKVTGQIWCQ